MSFHTNLRVSFDDPTVCGFSIDDCVCTPGEPTGLKGARQDRMLWAGFTPIYQEKAEVWNYVTRERGSEDWALHCIFRNELPATLREEVREPARGPRLWRVTLRTWMNYIPAAAEASLARVIPETKRTFYWPIIHQKVRGRTAGYRLGTN